MRFCAGLGLTVTNWVAPVARLTAVTPSSGSVPAGLTFGTAGTGRPLPHPSSVLAAHRPFGATARPREKSPTLYRTPAGRTYRPSGRMVARAGTKPAVARSMGPAAPAVWVTESAPAKTHSENTVTPANERRAMSRRRRILPKRAMAMRSFAISVTCTVAGILTGFRL